MRRFLLEYNTGQHFYETDTLDNIDWDAVVSVTERTFMTRDEVAKRFPELNILEYHAKNH
jgi:hypothetical protein